MLKLVVEGAAAYTEDPGSLGAITIGLAERSLHLGQGRRLELRRVQRGRFSIELELAHGQLEASCE